MKLERSCKNNIFNENKGFSIVEVLVAVAILSVVFAPLLKSFSTSANVNSRAQKLQNATSLAESVMEEVKSNSIQKLHDMAIDRTDVTFTPEDEGGGLTKGKLNNTPPYTVFYENVTATQGITYDAKATISTDKYSYDKSGMDEADDGYSDVSDINLTELPDIDKVDSDNHAVISWEINQYDKKAMDNLAAENSVSDSDAVTLKTSYLNSAEKNINIVIKEDSGMTKITCEVEYKPQSGKSLKYLVYSGYFDDHSLEREGGPNVYLFYTLSEKSAPGEFFKKENVDIEDKTSGKRHSVYFIMQDGINKLSTTSGSSVSLNVHGGGWSGSINYNASSTIDSSTKWLAGETTTDNETDDVVFISNLLDSGNKEGNLFDVSKRNRVYYVTVEIMEHGKTDVLAKLTSTMQAGEEAY